MTPPDPLTYAARLVHELRSAEEYRKECIETPHAMEGVVIAARDWAKMLRLDAEFPAEADARTCWLDIDEDPSESMELGDHLTPEAAAHAWHANAKNCTPDLGEPCDVRVVQYCLTHNPPGRDCGFNYEPGRPYWDRVPGSARTVRLVFTAALLSTPPDNAAP